MKRDKEEWCSMFSNIFDRAVEDPNPSVPVAFLDYLLNPEPMSPFIPIAEHYLNTARINQPEICPGVDKCIHSFTIAEGIWSMLGSRSCFNPRLRKLLFLLYKQLFGLKIPEIYNAELRKDRHIEEFDPTGTPLEIYSEEVDSCELRGLMCRWRRFISTRERRAVLSERREELVGMVKALHDV